MARTMTHRGPDDERVWCDATCSLGFCRLAVIRPNDNVQPSSNEDGTIRSVFNGEIYNFLDLRERLEKAGHRFASDGDAEVLVHAYEEFGDDFLDELNGMFALAVYDACRQRLLLARDRLGIKPLYMYVDDRRVIFGSEVKAILAGLPVTPALNAEGLLSLLTFEYIYPPHTLFSGVEKLAAGERAVVTASAFERRRWWTVPCAPPDSPGNDHDEELRATLSDSVRLRLQSDVPIGVFLSGGVDSTILTALAAQHRPGIRTFHLCVGGLDYREAEYARAAAERFGTDHLQLSIGESPADLTEKLPLWLDDPIGDFSLFATYVLCREARQTMTVALGGDGGDELFGGYDTYVADRAARWLGPMAAGPHVTALRRLVGCIRPTAHKKGLINEAHVFLEGLRRPPSLGHVRWMMFLDAEQHAGLFTDAFGEQIAEIDPTGYVRALRSAVPELPIDGQNMYVDTNFYLSENILHKVDRASMAVSLEVRVPILDYRVVELASRMPVADRLGWLRRKTIMKRVFASMLPPAIRQRKKQGFSVPMKHWLRDELRPLMTDVLSGSSLRRGGVFRPLAVERLMAEHLSGRRNHSHLLWSIVLSCMWLDRFTRLRTAA